MLHNKDLIPNLLFNLQMSLFNIKFQDILDLFHQLNQTICKIYNIKNNYLRYGKSYGRTTNLVSNDKIEDFDETKPWTTTSEI